MPRLTPDGPPIYPDCGTTKAYSRHLKTKTQACRPCKDARADATREYRYTNGLVSGRIVPLEIARIYLPKGSIR